MICSCAEMVNKAVRILFVGNGDAGDISDLVQEIDNLESETDHLERSLIRTIFQLHISSGEKMIFKSLVRKLTKVTDDAESVGDRLILVSIKRRI
jgi:uncharacterized protein Yka (UPF0111/DUF47 family)